jgi:hypothetical protein
VVNSFGCGLAALGNPWFISFGCGGPRSALCVLLFSPFAFYLRESLSGRSRGEGRCVNLRAIPDSVAPANAKAESRDPQSAIMDSARRDACHGDRDGRAPQSAIRNPQSAIRNWVTARRSLALPKYGCKLLVIMDLQQSEGSFIFPLTKMPYVLI